jgi:hypothetical protein
MKNPAIITVYCRIEAPRFIAGKLSHRMTLTELGRHVINSVPMVAQQRCRMADPRVYLMETYEDQTDEVKSLIKLIGDSEDPSEETDQAEARL